MTPQQVRAWRQRMGWSQAHAALQIGRDVRTLKSWEKGRNWRGRDAGPDRTARLAMTALAHGLRDPADAAPADTRELHALAASHPGIED